MRATVVRSVVACVGVLGLAGSLGCSARGTVVREQVVRTEDGLAVPGPFAPKAMRIHPLTHQEIGAEGNARVVLHVELKDAWGDTVKGIGRIQAQVWRDGESPERSVKWDVDLRSLDDNARFYDPATRTYRIVLAGLPGWLDEAVRAGKGGVGRLRVLFLTAEPDGSAVVLRDEGVVQP